MRFSITHGRTEHKIVHPLAVLLHECPTEKLTCVVLKVDSPPHGIDHRLGLLKDLLLHEGAVVACGGRIRNQLNISTLKEG